MARRFPRLIRTCVLASVLAISATLLIGVQSADSRTVPICFPVADKPVRLTNSFGDPRGGGSRSHEGEDIMGEKMFKIVAPVSGRILDGDMGIRWRGNGHSGHAVRMLGDDGNFYGFLHMNDDTPGTDGGQAPRSQVFGPGIKSGARVQAGQLLGYMGDSGNAEGSGAHLHFEMLTPSSSNPDSYWSANPFDPYPSLKAARPCGDGTIGHTDIKQLIPGDFDGDGKGEMFAYVPGAGRDRVYALGSDNTLETFDTTNVGGTYQPLTGDFDGDHKTDILWYGPGTTPESIWYGTATTGEFETGSAPDANGTYEPLTGDFDGDGRSDVLWYAPGIDRDYVWYGTGTRGEFSSQSVTANGLYEPFIGDFDGDGASDIMWYGPGTDPDYVWYGSRERGTFSSRARISNGVYEPFTGDFDGDGHDDIFWYAPGTARDYVWYGDASRGGYESANRNVNGTYSPVALDLDGDQHDDIFWWRRGTAVTPTWLGSSERGEFAGVRF